MPNSTMNKITDMELSALRSNASFATAMSPLAVVPTRATVRMGRTHAMTLRKISASRTTMSSRVTMLTMASACCGRLLRVQRLGRRPGHARAEVSPLDQRLEVGAQGAGVLDGGRVEGVLARLDLHEDRLHQAVLRHRGCGRGAQVVIALGVELLGDGGHLGLVGLGQPAAVLAVEDHDRADLTALGKGFLLHGECLDGLVVLGQELRLVLRGLQGGGCQGDDHGGHDPGGDDPPASADDEPSESSEHGPNAIETAPPYDAARATWRDRGAGDENRTRTVSLGS